MSAPVLPTSATRPEAEDAALALVPGGLLIGGTWRAAAGDGTFAVEDPATQVPLADVADATVADGVAALDAAAAAQADWAASSPRVRADILRHAYELVRESTEQLALLVTLEMGKPLAEARGEIAYAAEYLRWFSEEAPRSDGTFGTSPDGAARIIVSRRPVGPCLLVTPWNFPLAMAARKVAPAIAAGCTMVLKPAEQTPLTSLAFAELMTAAGLPHGVLNVVTTSRPAELVGRLMRDPRLRKISFTGSTAVGSILMAQAAEQILRVSFELGGNAPFIVLDDADLDIAIDAAMVAKMRNMGEACTAANRFLVARSVADEFAQRLAERMSGLQLGRGTEPGVDVGPLIDDAARDKVERLVADAADRGATVLAGGSAPAGPGYFYEPTVLAGVAPDSAMLAEEVFGPVAPVIPFDHDQDAVAMANDTPYGLVAYVFSSSLQRSLRTCDALEVGMVGLNQGIVSNAAAPFGGVKRSGLGREGGRVGLEEYQALQYIATPV